MIVGILGPGGCGGTFLDWSIQFIAGSTENLVAKCNEKNRNVIEHVQAQQIVDNPLNGSSAHIHQKTHPNNDSLTAVLDIFLSNNYPLNTFYYVDSMLPDQTHTNYNSIIKTHPTVKFISYNFSRKHLDLIFCLQYEKISVAPQNFNNQIGNSLSNLSIGERREMLSLFYPRCIKGQILNEQIEDSDNLYRIDFDDVWGKLDIVMINIFKFLGLGINESRYSEWIKIYQIWLTKNKNNFFNDLPEIIDCIVNNKSLDLKVYNITFAKEVVIASKLLYNHNLSLKFNDVSDLTSDTLQWHSILEKNTYHNLEIGRV